MTAQVDDMKFFEMQRKLDDNLHKLTRRLTDVGQHRRQWSSMTSLSQHLVIAKYIDELYDIP